MYRRKLVGVLVAAVAAVAVTQGSAAAMTNGTLVTDPNTAPWVATLAFPDGSAIVPGGAPLLQRATCGGALIAPARVLTAAHCVDRADPSQLEVHIDARVLSADDGQVRRIVAVSALPGYRILPSPVDPSDDNLASAANDLAIVVLDRPVTTVAPIPLALSRPTAGSRVSLFAHGTTGQSGADFRDDVLHRGDLAMIDHWRCSAQTPAVVDEPSMACAEDPTGLVNLCYQDSGSPVVQYVAGRPELVGVASFGGETAGHPCTVVTPEPVAFTDVATFHAWSQQPSPAGEPYPAGRATVTGTGHTGSPLHCASPAWDRQRGGRPDEVRYGWATVTEQGPFAIPAPIGGADAVDYTPAGDLAGQRLACEVTARNAAGTSQSIAAPVMITDAGHAR